MKSLSGTTWIYEYYTYLYLDNYYNELLHGWLAFVRFFIYSCFKVWYALRSENNVRDNIQALPLNWEYFIPAVCSKLPICFLRLFSTSHAGKNIVWYHVTFELGSRSMGYLFIAKSWFLHGHVNYHENYTTFDQAASNRVALGTIPKF